ncbi:MAG: dihydroneopterin aldolase [Flammeovirgaceae bacterium]|nr:dihydroneopterin aldolase [Flammeovirgaceae bacterium]|tara:strand:- start:1761 stop:2111 length:351 start_codon:yes stop_codon:yes gene_type:complete
MAFVSLEGMEFFANHGYYEEERKVGNKYSVDVKLELNVDFAGREDKLEGTVDYQLVYELISKVMSKEAALLEYLANQIVKLLKSKFPEVKKIWVKVAKYNPPIQGLCHRAVVELSS